MKIKNHGKTNETPSKRPSGGNLCVLCMAIVAVLILTALCALFMTSCADDHGLSRANPITLTMWHNYGGTMQESMDLLIDEFNSTVGKERGIIINVTAITASAELQTTMGMIINGDPGAPEMPDITTAYPKTAILFQEKGMIADLDDYFTKAELDEYLPDFISEGRFADGFYVFPIAKSTEIIYLNQTLFDRFAAECGVGIESLATLEGIADVASRYYDWTDAQTPDVEGDGKAFFSADSWLNLAQTAMMQSGGMLFDNEKLELSDENYKRLWDICYRATEAGGFAVYDGYSSDLSKTGDLICSTGSSAGILFFGDTVTYTDGTSEKVEYSILSYPTLDGGEKYAIQRGNGMIVKKSDETREWAACVFLRWLSAPEQNMRFISRTGYLPVTKKAFDEEMDAHIASLEDKWIKNMLLTVTAMYGEYNFFTAPVFDGFDAAGKQYESAYKSVMTKYIGEGAELGDKALAEFISALS